MVNLWTVLGLALWVGMVYGARRLWTFLNRPDEDDE
jgi:hypothetical protein